MTVPSAAMDRSETIALAGSPHACSPVRADAPLLPHTRFRERRRKCCPVRFEDAANAPSKYRANQNDHASRGGGIKSGAGGQLTLAGFSVGRLCEPSIHLAEHIFAANREV